MREWAPYALLNLAACAALIAIVPHLAREGARGVLTFTSEAPLPKPPNLVEQREVHAARRPAPTPDVLARLPETAIPSAPLSSDTKSAVVDLIARTPVEAVPLAAALDSAESLPAKPLRQLYKTRYRALYAELLTPKSQRRAVAANRSGAALRTAARAQRAKMRDVLAFTAGYNETPGAIAHRSFGNTLASLSP